MSEQQARKVKEGRQTSCGSKYLFGTSIFVQSPHGQACQTAAAVFREQSQGLSLPPFDSLQPGSLPEADRTGKVGRKEKE